jgi:hypothetical protein
MVSITSEVFAVALGEPYGLVSWNFTIHSPLDVRKSCLPYRNSGVGLVWGQFVRNDAGDHQPMIVPAGNFTYAVCYLSSIAWYVYYVLPGYNWERDPMDYLVGRESLVYVAIALKFGGLWISIPLLALMMKSKP